MKPPSSSFSNPMSIDLPPNMPVININPSVCNDALVDSVSLTDLNLNYVSLNKSILRSSFDLLNILDFSEKPIPNTIVEIGDLSKSISVNKLTKYIKSSDDLQNNSITPIESKMFIDGSTSFATSSNPSVNHNCNILVISYPPVLQNSPEFWYCAIRSVEEVEVKIRLTKKHNFEYLSAVARCINFSPRTSTPQPIAVNTSSFKSKGKENVEPKSIGPSNLKKTKHLMLQQS
ncbi:hypothetical protein ZOSMA_44G00100 [Zostera marina]|uniref:Uncharacterized protein n=1 Tax=Zostera marina TaxID=29655 RepID=A0A0K9P0Q3_ZOSMR|nr:hypothetical protein ZOSMA_44G00100 [Zostera marina]